MTNYSGKIVNSEEYRARRREYMREWRLRPENLERARANNRASRARAKAANPETFSAKDRERHARYYATPEAKAKKIATQRVHAQRGLYRRRGLNKQDQHEYWIHQGGICDFCGQPYPDPAGPGGWRNAVVDHDRNHCNKLIGCRECVRAQGHRSCNVIEGQIRRAIAVGVIDSFTGRLAGVLNDPPLQRWLASRVA